MLCCVYSIVHYVYIYVQIRNIYCFMLSYAYAYVYMKSCESASKRSDTLTVTPHGPSLVWYYIVAGMHIRV